MQKLHHVDASDRRRLHAEDLQRRFFIMPTHAGIDITRVMNNMGSRVREHDEILASVFK
jgi:tRNA G10  N-methylase Trm11